MIERAETGSWWVDSDMDLWLKTESGAEAMLHPTAVKWKQCDLAEAEVEFGPFRMVQWVDSDEY